MRRLLALAVLALLTGLALGSAEARVESSTEYTKAQAYSAALRYLRVDLGFEVVERDPDAAYLIFRYQPSSGDKTASNGSIEIVAAASRTLIVVQLTRMPEYHERVLRDGLLRKLENEYGAPPRPKAPAQKPKAGAGDAGT
jgi:hypothetical protein